MYILPEKFWVRISSTLFVLWPFSYLRPFLYFDRSTSTSLLRPFYFELFISTRLLRPFVKSGLIIGREVHVEVKYSKLQKRSNWCVPKSLANIWVKRFWNTEKLWPKRNFEENNNFIILVVEAISPEWKRLDYKSLKQKVQFMRIQLYKATSYSL
mgnify:CR=1 FL=1